MPIPDFRTLDPRIDDRAQRNPASHCLARDLSSRYATADELLYDLEYYIYHRGYGPTNETLGKFIRELFGQTGPAGRRGAGRHRQHPASSKHTARGSHQSLKLR